MTASRVLVSASVLFASAVRAEDSAPLTTPSSTECAQAYEQAQEERKSGKLVAARDALRLCARDECPDFIHADCLTWHGEVQAELPTVVFRATTQGRDLTQVTVTFGDRVLATRLEGQVLELDPGEYELRFSAPEMRPQSAHFVVARGERNRLLRVELVPLAATAPPPIVVAEPLRPRSYTTPAIFTGLALAGVGGFVALGAWGRSSESKLEDRCAPDCPRGDVADVRTKYVLADVSLGVGVVSLGLAAYTFFRQERSTTSGASGLGMQAGASDFRLSYGGRF